MAKDGQKGKVIDFRTARKSAEPPAQIKAAANASSSQRGRFLDTWLKAHEDKDELIQENLRTQKQKEDWERKYNALKPTIQDHILFYLTLLIQFLGLVIWMAFALSRYMS